MRSANKHRPWSRLLAIVNSPPLWLAVASLPSIIIFCNRVFIPDTSTDVLSYHLFNGMRALHHPFVPFLPSEFYPVGIANIAPLYDGFTYIVRSMLGYRLGTILSLFAAIGCIWIIYRLLRLMLREQNKRFHAGWGLLLVNAGIVLELGFQLATYDVDVINAFAILVVLYFVVRQFLRDKKLPLHMGWWIGLWLALGSLLALKLTNLPLVIPMALLLVWDWWWWRGARGGKRGALYIASVALIIVPLLPGWLGNYRLSHNPLFPYYNAVFQSSDYAATNFTDKTFGGTTLVAKAFWPVASLSNQLRLAEPHHIYNDYKLILYWSVAVLLAALMLLRWVRLGSVGTILLFYFLASTLLWGLLFGIERYFMSSMLLGGLILALPFAAIVRLKRFRFGWLLLAIGIVAIVVSGIEDYRIMRFNLHYDISWRPPLYQNHQLHKSQKPSLFARQLTLTAAERQTVLSADIFLNCNTDVVGLLTLLPDASSKPTVNIIADGLPQYADMSNNPHYRQQRLQRLHTALPTKHTYTWVSIVSDKDIAPTAAGCYRNIVTNSGIITAYQPINDFLGLQGIHLILISGEITF